MKCSYVNSFYGQQLLRVALFQLRFTLGYPFYDSINAELSLSQSIVSENFNPASFLSVP
jgi:hypothetical protein